MIDIILNKKKTGRSFLFGFFLALFMPMVMAMRNMVDEDTGGSADEKALAATIKAQIKSEISELQKTMKEFASQEDIQKEIAKIAKQIEEQNIKGLTDKLAGLEKAAEEQGLAIKKIGEKETVVKTLRQLYEENVTKIVEAAGRKSSHSFETKANVIRSNITSDTQSMRLPGIGELSYGSVGMESIFNQGNVTPNSHGVIRYVDQLAVTRSAAAIAEEGIYPTSAITWQEYTLALQKIGDSIPVSYEALQDIDFMESELRRLLTINLAIKRNLAYWSGTGIAPEIKGIYTYATAWDAGAYAGTKALAGSLYDLLVVLRAVLSTGKQSKYNANFVVMNPMDILKMKLQKNEFGQYVMPPFANGQNNVDSMVVYENSVVTANTLVIGDFRYATRYTMGGVEIEVGMINEQFTHDLMTIKARERSALLVRNVDLDAFLKVTDVNAAIAAVTSGA